MKFFSPVSFNWLSSSHETHIRILPAISSQERKCLLSIFHLPGFFHRFFSILLPSSRSSSLRSPLSYLLSLHPKKPTNLSFPPPISQYPPPPKTLSNHKSKHRINPTQQHPPNPPIDTLPNFHNPPIRSHKHSLPHPSQSPHISLLIPARQRLERFNPHPYPSRRFTDAPHFAQYRLVAIVFHADPESAGGDV